MALNLHLLENAASLVACAVLVLLAFVFFSTLYVVDFKESRTKAKKKQEYQRALRQNQKRRQKRAAR